MSVSSHGLPNQDRRYNRREFHRLCAIGALGATGGVELLGACSSHTGSSKDTPQQHYVYEKYMPEIVTTENARPKSGRTTAITVNLKVQDIDLGGPIVSTPVYNSQVPAPAFRAKVGDVIEATINNQLSTPTNVHWHGLNIRNDADGSGTVDPPVPSGQSQKLAFTVPDAGTYWVHPHFFHDTDMGMYAPFIIDDPHERGDYDQEWIVVLDDWACGIGPDIDTILAGLGQGSDFDARGIYSPHQGRGVHTPGLIRQRVKKHLDDMPWKTDDDSMDNHTPAPSQPGRKRVPAPRYRFHAITTAHDQNSITGDVGDVTYPYYLINGRIPEAATRFRAKPGQKIRIRIINASADTAYTVALADHQMTITHTDGSPISPIVADAVIIGMAERYDVIVTTKSGVFPLVARAEGKSDIARALLVTGSGSSPAVGFRPDELNGRKFFASQFTGIYSPQDVKVDRVDTSMDFVLTGSMKNYIWKINNHIWPYVFPDKLPARACVQFNFINKTTMWHPMHFHGHKMCFTGKNHTVIQKDTVLVAPHSSVSSRIYTDNPGAWLIHCHNTFHMDSGMMGRLDYVV